MRKCTSKRVKFRELTACTAVHGRIRPSDYILNRARMHPRLLIFKNYKLRAVPCIKEATTAVTALDMSMLCSLHLEAGLSVPMPPPSPSHSQTNLFNFSVHTSYENLNVVRMPRTTICYLHEFLGNFYESTPLANGVQSNFPPTQGRKLSLLISPPVQHIRL